jgi:hypothetical protein
VGNISNVIDSNTNISQISTVTTGVSPIAVFVSGKYAYTADYASNTISVIDVSNPLSPTRVGFTTVGQSPYGIVVSGKYAYVTNYGEDSISVVDVSIPSAPVQLVTTTVDVGVGAYSTPTGLYIAGKYLYVVNFGTNELAIFDVSNPINPIKIRNIIISKDPLAVYVQGNYAYTVNNDASSMSVIDISDPYASREVATTSVGLNPQGLYVSGRYAYVTNYTSSTMNIVDISNPFAPVRVSTTSVGILPSSVYVSGRYAYVTNDTSGTLAILDVSNVAAPIIVKTISVGLNPFSVYVSGRYAYVANSGSDTISIVDISGTEVLSLIAHSADVGSIQSRNDVFAQGNIMAGTSLMVGAGGIMSQGPLSVFASSTGGTSTIFNIASSQAPNLFKVFSNGNVALGTSTGASLFTIQGSSNTSIFNVVSSTSASVFKILANGNIGVNSSTPYAQFSVVGDMALTGGLYDANGTRGLNGQILQTNGTSVSWVSTSSLGLSGGGSYSSWTLATSTDDVGYSVTSSVRVIVAGINGVTTTRSNSSISVGLENSGISAGAYGSASAVPVFTVDVFGRIVSNTTSSIAISGNQITSGIVSSTYGGTGQNSSAWTGLVRVTAGTWSTTTVSLATDINGVLSIANGGTNSSTLASNGSLIYSDGTRYNAVAVGNSGYILQSTGGSAPVWVATSSLGFINLQGSYPGTQQTGGLNISGIGIVGTSFGIGTSTVSSTLVVQAIAGANPLNVVSSSGQAH